MSFIINPYVFAAGGFNPGGVAGCTMWVSADQASISGTGDGNPVSTWLDQITGTRTWTGASTARPLFQTNEINGLPVLQFDAVNDQMSFSVASSNIWTASAFSIFAVVRPQTAGHASMSEAGKNIITSNGYVGLCLLSTGGNNKFSFYRFNGGYTGANSTTNYSTGSVYIVECVYDGTNLKIKVNNDTEVSQAASNPQQLTDTPQISFGAAMGADLAELITYNVALSGGDRTTLRNGLATKWNVTLAP